MAALSWCVIIVILLKGQILAENSLHLRSDDKSKIQPKPLGPKRDRDPYDVIAVSQKQVEQVPEYLLRKPKSEPSCAELRVIWNRIQRILRYSDMTNELPVFPLSLPKALINYILSYPSYFENSDIRLPKELFSLPIESNLEKSLKGAISHKQKSLARQNTLTGNFGDTISRHNHQANNNYNIYNHSETHNSHSRIDPSNLLVKLARFPYQQEPLGGFGTVLRKPEDKILLEKQQRLEKMPEPFPGNVEISPLHMNTKDSDNGFGTLGEFAPNLEQSRQNKNNYHYGTLLNEMSSMEQQVFSHPEEKEKDLTSEMVSNDAVNLEKTCKVVNGNPCQTDEDCFCFNTVLQCVATRCEARQSHSLSRQSGVFTDDQGTWHSGPLNSAKLGISRKK
ncbi:uncharacterized protein LOC111084435 [Limulus polyphemus]|uniref:Uncharacterized protein LOC111084435 n=1 Tax=Limulus polyphemus TaxID=6850 RepID=A0ABM1RZP5_LIMPO|nr:uncharacterized protein LOC111084435 [Limulus polyphemus]